MSSATAVFLGDLTVALVAATVLGSFARAARVTPILGYVAAGIAIGPFTPGYHTGAASLGGLGEFGLILLLFSLGLGFSAEGLRAVGAVPMAGNVVLMALFGVAAWALASAFSFPHPITLSLTFTLSSTAIGVALLAAFGILEKRPGQAAVALLVAQDLIAVLMLVITTTPPEHLTVLGALVPMLKAALFVIVALALGATVLHRFVIAFLRRASSEVIIAFCTAVALVSAWIGHLAGLSFEFGAFVAGAVTSEAAGSRIVQSVIAPFRELFVMIFFVSIGTLVDVKALIASWPAIACIGAAMAALRFGGWYGLSRYAGQRAGTALALGIALVPLGEFNVVLANDAFLAKRLNVSEFGTAIGATLVSILLAAIAARIAAPRRAAIDAEAADDTLGKSSPAVLIIGYGRVGRTVSAVCRRAGIDHAVIDLDVDLVRLAQHEGVEAHYGDGADPSVVERAIGPATRIVLSTIPETAANAAVARRLSHHKHLRIVSRAERLRDVAPLRKAGATEVLVPEAEGAFGFAQAILIDLGVSQDEIDALIRDQRAALSY